MDEDEIRCGEPGEQDHYFDVPVDDENHDDLRCRCGEYAWGWMNEQKVLTEMWQATA